MIRRLVCPPASFTPKERDLIRRELCRHFGQDPRIAGGIFLRVWRAGERKGQPKIPPAVQSMLDRGLIEIQSSRLGPRACFTGAGLRELRALLRDPARWIQSDLPTCARNSG